jgi:cytoskeletal protein CcmA (bactofilin family)
MVWFDRNPGGKKSPEVETEKPQETVKPVADAAPAGVAHEPKPAAKADIPAGPSTAGLVGYLYKGSRVTGQLSFQGPATIDGVVDGEIQCQGTLNIGAGAEVRAKISGHAVVIRGKVEGNVTAKESIELAAPARLIGNIDTPRLIITEGVVFDGDCSMGVVSKKGGTAPSQGVSAEKAAVAQGPKLQADSKG